MLGIWCTWVNFRKVVWLNFHRGNSVIPEGRITHGDLGIWSNDHINGFAEICYFVHQNNCKMGVQLGHAGRKQVCNVHGMEMAH